MSRLKRDKNALKLFIATIVIIIEAILFSVFCFIIIGTGDVEDGFYFILGYLHILAFFLFQIISGFTCAFTARWKKPAIVFGIIQAVISLIISIANIQYLSIHWSYGILLGITGTLFLINIVYVYNAAVSVPEPRRYVAPVKHSGYILPKIEDNDDPSDKHYDTRRKPTTIDLDD